MEVLNNNGDEDESVVVSSDENNDDAEDDLPISFGNGTLQDLAEGSALGKPVTAEVLVKKKRKAHVRIDTSILDNVNCTACGQQLNPYKSNTLQKHPELKVVICKHCEKFLSSGEITKDKDGTDEQCRWCGEGGRLVVCDQCSRAFCKSCVMRNFSRSEFNNINSQENWQCYLCNTAPVQALQENYKKIRSTLKALQEKTKSADVNSNGTVSGEKSAGCKQNSRGNRINSVRTSTSRQRNLNESSKSSNDDTRNILLSLSDCKVNHGNVDSAVERLIIATHTFIDVLKAIQAPADVSFNFVNIQAKRQQRLNASLETYMKSLKKILTDSQNKDVMDISCSSKSDKEPSYSPSSSKTNELTRFGSKFQQSASCNTESAAKNSVCIKDSFSLGTNEIIEISTLKDSNVLNDLAPECFVNCGSKSLDIISRHTKIPSPHSTKFRSNPVTMVTKVPTIDHTAKENVGKGSKEITNNEIEKSNESASSGTEHDKIDSRVEINNENSLKVKKKVSVATDKQTILKTGLKTPASSNSENMHEDNQVPEDTLISSSDSSLSQSAEPIEKQPASNSQLSNHDDENIAAKNDIINEILRDNKDNDIENDDCDNDDINLLSNFGDEENRLGEYKKSHKGKAEKMLSDQYASSSEKRSKGKKSGDTLKSAKKSLSKTGFDTLIKGNISAADARSSMVEAASSDSSSDLVISDDDDDDDLINRKEKKKSKKVLKAAAKNMNRKKAAEKSEKNCDTDKESAVKSPSLDDKLDDIDKEIAKLSKLPAIRKRKASNENEDEMSEEAEVSKIRQNAPKRAKPGPKSSKKIADYDELSSDESGKESNENEDDDADDDEEDIMAVTRLQSEADSELQKELNSDENERAKNGLLEDMNNENDDVDDETSSSSEDTDDSEKPAKKRKQHSNKSKDKAEIDAEKCEDSDENIGKRKKISSKLLDAKLSESDSDVGMPKR